MPRNTTSLAAEVGLALAACAFALPAQAEGNVIDLQLTPAGEFLPTDGRPMDVAAWRINAAAAARVIERFKARKTAPVIDYEHQTLHKEANGQPAPAAAWVRDIQWREGQGLYASVELTQRAREHIQAREYRYFSPVFSYHRQSGEVLDILMGAFTNHPAIDGMEPLALRAAATFGISSHPNAKDLTLNPLLTAVLTALGLAANATEEQAIAALSAFKPATGDGLGDVRRALALGDQADATAVVAACTQLRANQADPARFVPIAALTQVQTELAALTTKIRDTEVEQLVAAALADGRLLAGEQEKWARDLGRSNQAALTAYLKTAQPIAALTRTQTGGKEPLATGAHGLSDEALAVCKATGLTPEQFKAGAATAA